MKSSSFLYTSIKESNDDSGCLQASQRAYVSSKIPENLRRKKSFMLFDHECRTYNGINQEKPLM